MPRHSYQRCSTLALSSAVAWDIVAGNASDCSQNNAGHVLKQTHASNDAALVVALGTRQGDVVLLRFAGEQ